MPNSATQARNTIHTNPMEHSSDYFLFKQSWHSSERSEVNKPWAIANQTSRERNEHIIMGERKIKNKDLSEAKTL